MVSSISRSIPSPPPRPTPPHYQTYLTPLLHRRFARSCAIAIVLCYVEAYLISSKSSIFWSIFPLSWTGLKTMILFFCTALPILVLRISQLHVGTRASPSLCHTLQRCIGSFATYNCIGTYMFAGLIFILLYILSSTNRDNLGFINEGKSYERPRLNERFLYLVFFAVYTGLVQGVIHITTDKGRLDMPAVTLPPKEAFKKGSPKILSNTFILSLVSSITGPIVYSLVIRQTFWKYTLQVARMFYWLNRSTTLPSFPVGPGLFIRSGWIAFMLGILWETSHLAFAVHFTQDPLKEGKVVSELSPDPNGTLVTGLKASKAPLTQVFALWELVFVSHNSPARRKAIFTDVDRKPSNIWEQIMKECLNILGDVDTKLAELDKPSPQPKVEQAPITPPAAPSSPPAIPISTESPLLSTPNSTSRKFLESVQSKDGASPNLELMKRLQIPAPPIADVEATVVGKFMSKIEPILASPVGIPFRHTIEMRNAIIIPNPRLQLDAVSALSQLIVSSLNEDEYGVVQNHVPAVLHAFVTTMEALEKYVASPPIHWTDVYAKRNKDGVDLQRPKVLLRALRAAMRKIVVAFRPYMNDMKLSADVKRNIKESDDWVEI